VTFHHIVGRVARSYLSNLTGVRGIAHTSGKLRTPTAQAAGGTVVPPRAAAASVPAAHGEGELRVLSRRAHPFKICISASLSITWPTVGTAQTNGGPIVEDLDSAPVLYALAPLY
jgi:hypothetical protein